MTMYEDKYELEYKDFTPKMKKGIAKFSRLSSVNMRKVANNYAKTMGRNAYHILNKRHFYEWCEDML